LRDRSPLMWFQVTIFWETVGGIWETVLVPQNTIKKTLSMTIETNSFETIHLRPRSFDTTTFETTFKWDSFIRDSFIWDHVLLRPVHLKAHSFVTTHAIHSRQGRRNGGALRGTASLDLWKGGNGGTGALSYQYHKQFHDLSRLNLKQIYCSYSRTLKIQDGFL